MSTLIIGLLIIGWSATMVACALTMKPARSTPGRRTRGIARWWGRCWRWRHRLEPTPRKPAQRALQPVPWVMSREQVITDRQMQQIGRAMAGVHDRPSPAEFAAAPLYGYAMVDRLLGDLDDAGGR